MVRCSKIIGTGSYVPPFTVDNDTLCKYYPGKGTKWIEDKIGIKERRFGFDFTANKTREGCFDNDLAEKAARAALDMACISTAELELIVRITCTPEFLFFPDPACVLHSRLGASYDCAAFTIYSGCGGLVYALKNIDGQLRGNSSRKALVVASNSSSSFCDIRDRDAVNRNWLNAAIFGDGASALVLDGSSTNGKGILASYWGAWHEHDPMFYPAGGSRNPTRPGNVKDHWYKMNAKKVVEYAPKHLMHSVQEILKRYPVQLDEINWFLFHQANLRILERISEQYSIPIEKILVNVDKYGNTSAASIGILLDEGVRNGSIKEGDLLLLVGVGAGWQFGSLLVRW